MRLTVEAPSKLLTEYPEQRYVRPEPMASHDPTLTKTGHSIPRVTIYRHNNRPLDQNQSHRPLLEMLELAVSTFKDEQVWTEKQD